MSRTVDDRIVKMSFDTSKFKSGVDGVLKGLQSIDKSLNKDRTFKGLDRIGKSISDVTNNGMGALSRSIGGVSGDFSMLQMAGSVALGNLASKAATVGMNMIKSLTLDPVMDGFGEYELKMNSISTILTNTAAHGTKLKDVNAALNDLNEYSDKTIYNFAQMTDNIGKATAAGLELGEAVDFVKGMANTAAAFGVDATKMAGATYQMTQALASGFIKAQDWMSMEQAGMAGQLLQDKLIANAEKAGKKVDLVGKSFKQSLESGWLTADIFSQTMSEMANDDTLTKKAGEVTSLTKLFGVLKEAVGSGWAQTFEKILGNKDESTKLFTGINDAITNGIINPMTEAREVAVDTWLEMGGRTNTIKAFSNIWTSIGRIIGPIGEAFANVFPSRFGEILGNISQGFLKLSEALLVNKDVSRFIKDAFTGLFKVIDFGIQTLGFFLQPLQHLFNGLSQIGGVVGAAILAFFKMTYALGDYVKQLTVVQQAQQMLKGAFDFIGGIGKTLLDTFNKGTEKITKFFEGITKGLDGLYKGKDTADGVSKSVDNVTKSFEGVKTVGGFVAKAFDMIKQSGIDIREMFDNARDGADNAVESFVNFIGSLKDYIINCDPIAGATELIVSAWESLGNAGNKIKDLFKSIDLSPITDQFVKIKDAISPIVDTVIGVFDTFKSAFKDLFGELDLNVGQILLTLSGFAAGFGVFKIFNTIGDIIGKILNPIGTLSEAAVGVLDGVKGVLVAYQNDIQANTLQKIGVAVLMLSGALLILSQINPDKLSTGLLGVGSLLAGVVAALAVVITMTKDVDIKGILAITPAFLAMSGAVFTMSLAVMLLSNLNMEELAVGLLGMAGSLGVMVMALSVVSGMTGPLISGAFAISLLAGSLIIMFGAISLFSLMDITKMNNSLITVGAALGILVLGAVGLNQVYAGLIGTATGIGILAGALILMANATKKFGEMDSDVILQGLTSVTIIIGALSIFAKSTSKAKLSFSMGTGLMAMAKALDMLYKPLSLFGQMNIGELVKGITSLGLVMAGLTLMSNKLKPKTGWALIQTAAGLILFAKAIDMFCNTTAGLSNIDSASFASGIFKIALSMGILGMAIAIIPERDLLLLAAGIMGLSIALKSMTKSIESAGDTDMETMIKGLAGMAGALTIVGMALTLVPEWQLITLAIGMTALALGFTAMILPITKLGSLDFSVIAKGLFSILSVVGLLALINMGGLATMGLVPLSGGLILLSVALTALVVPIQLLGTMDLQTLAIGILAMVAVLGALGLIAFILTPVVPILFGLASSILLLGTGMMAASGGLTLFSAGFALFATTCSLFGDEILNFFVTFCEKLPVFVEGIALGFVKLLEVIGQNGPTITTAVYQILESILNAIIMIIPLVANAMVNLILTIINTITSNMGKIAESGYQLIMGLLDGIGRYVPPIVAKCVEILVTMAGALMDNVVILVNAGIELVIQLINGMAEGISSNSEAFASAVNNLIFAVLDAMVDLGTDFFKRGSEFIVELVKGIFDGESDSKDAGGDVAQAGLDGADKTKPEWKTAGGDFSSGLASGISGGKSGVITSAIGVAKSAIAAAKEALDINSPSRVMATLGKWTSMGLAGGIKKFGVYAERAAFDVANDVIYGMSNPSNNLSLLDGLDFNPSIKPVLDLSNIESGARTIGGMFNGSISPLNSINAKIAGGIGNIQNGFDNSDVVKAIYKLRSDISKMNNTTNIIDGITYDDGSNINDTIATLINATIRERRV